MATTTPSRPCFASAEEKRRVLLALDAEVAAELARADFLRQARLERNARKRAYTTRTATTEGPVMRDLMNFTYGDVPVRVHLDDEGEPWFVAADLAKILGYRMASDMTRNLDEDERGTQIVRTPSGDQEMTVISESGLYSAILRSRIEGARPFKRWVTHEVLPSIRKTGAYAAPSSAPSSALTGEALMAAALVEAQRVLSDAQTTAIAAIEANDGLTITEFHKHYFSDMGARDFFQKLYDLDLLIDQRGQRGRDAKGNVKNGRMHMHPSAHGKKYFYLHAAVDAAGNRWERAWLTPAQAAERLAVSVKTLWRLRASGDGPRFSQRGQIVRYRVEDVDRWMEGGDGDETR